MHSRYERGLIWDGFRPAHHDRIDVVDANVPSAIQNTVTWDDAKLHGAPNLVTRNASYLRRLRYSPETLDVRLTGDGLYVVGLHEAPSFGAPNSANEG